MAHESASGAALRRYPRTAAAAFAFVLLAFIGLAASTIVETPSWAGSGGRGLGWVFTDVTSLFMLSCTVVLIGFVVSVAHGRRRRRKRGADDYEWVIEPPEVTGRAKAGLLIAAFGVIALLIAVVVAIAKLMPQSRTPAGVAFPPAAPLPVGSGGGTRPSRPALPSAPAHIDSSTLILVLAASAVVVAAVIATAYLIHRRRRGATSTLGNNEAAVAMLADAVERGGIALGQPNSPRAAILASYRSMEAALAAAGTSRRPAETPDDLLARAAGAGLVLSTAASRLCDLFDEARFSTHPMSADQQAQARYCLDEISDSLTRSVPA